MRASVRAASCSPCRSPRVTEATLVRFKNEYTPSGEENRAEPDVGRVWLGPIT